MADLEDEEDLASEEELPLTEEGTPEPAASITIPRASLGSRDVKEGETLTLRIVSVTEDGVQAEVAGERGSESDSDYEEPNAAIDQMAQPSGY